jgi:hypothetical protein
MRPALADRDTYDAPIGPANCHRRLGLLVERRRYAASFEAQSPVSSRHNDAVGDRGCGEDDGRAGGRRLW